MDFTRDRQRGIVLVAVSALFWRTAGPFVRMANLDSWSIVFWRSLFSALVIGAITLMQHRGRLAACFRGIGLPGLASIVLSIVAMIAYVVTLQLTSVANVMIVYATLPFVTTAIAFLWIGERVTRRFLVAGALALSGVVITAGAVTTAHDLLGIVVAFVMTAGFGAQLVLMKRYPTLDMMVLITVAAAACVPVAAPFIAPAVPAVSQLLACALFGVLTTGLAYVLALSGGRLISSGEAALISLLDVVLGPLWVWLFYAERPSVATLVGGLIVLAAVLWYIATTARAADVPAVAGRQASGG